MQTIHSKWSEIPKRFCVRLNCVDGTAGTSRHKVLCRWLEWHVAVSGTNSNSVYQSCGEQRYWNCLPTYCFTWKQQIIRCPGGRGRPRAEQWQPKRVASKRFTMKVEKEGGAMGGGGEKVRWQSTTQCFSDGTLCQYNMSFHFVLGKWPAAIVNLWMSFCAPDYGWDRQKRQYNFGLMCCDAFIQFACWIERKWNKKMK